MDIRKFNKKFFILIMLLASFLSLAFFTKPLALVGYGAVLTAPIILSFTRQKLGIEATIKPVIGILLAFVLFTLSFFIFYLPISYEFTSRFVTENTQTIAGTFSDFKTNEYRQLIGGGLYEFVESNPMLGWRGASRYYDTRFREAFGLECLAIKKVREEMGLENVTPMVPFCRTLQEGRKVIALMKEFRLSKEVDPKLRIIMMCEVPSNVILADEFLDIFDGMSIGSNDLTQLVLGIDRDSGIGASIGNENDPAVKQMIATVIAKCREKNKYIGICGQAPSDYPEFTKFLIEQGIESISLNPDAVIPTILHIAKFENELHNKL
jgi:phosphoenolpyruvate synthase/pyruvate phosphate dikinase